MIDIDLLFLLHTIVCVLADMGRMESEDNTVFGDTCGDESSGDAVVEAVVVEPDFVLANFGIKQQAMNPFDAVPAFVDDQVAGLVLADDQLAGGRTIAVEDLAMFIEDIEQGLAVLIDVG